MSVRLEIPFDAWRAQMRQLPEELRDDAAADVTELTERAYSDIYERYPEHTGNLKKQLRRSVESSAFGVIGTVKNTAKHAHIFENGTKPRQTDAGANRGVMPPGRVFVPRMIRARIYLSERMRALLARAGFEVSGG